MITTKSEQNAAEFLKLTGKRIANLTEREAKNHWDILHGGDYGRAHGREFATTWEELEAAGLDELISSARPIYRRRKKKYWKINSDPSRPSPARAAMK